MSYFTSLPRDVFRLIMAKLDHPLQLRLVCKSWSALARQSVAVTFRSSAAQLSNVAAFLRAFPLVKELNAAPEDAIAQLGDVCGDGETFVLVIDQLKQGLKFSQEIHSLRLMLHLPMLNTKLWRVLREEGAHALAFCRRLAIVPCNTNPQAPPFCYGTMTEVCRSKLDFPGSVFTRVVEVELCYPVWSVSDWLGELLAQMKSIRRCTVETISPSMASRDSIERELKKHNLDHISLLKIDDWIVFDRETATRGK